MTEPHSVQRWGAQMSRAGWQIYAEKWPTGANERDGGENQKPGLIRAGLLLGLPTVLGSHGPLGTTLRRDRLSYFAHEKGLQVRLRTGPLQANNGVPGECPGWHVTK
jgi:hypothetical protein